MGSSESKTPQPQPTPQPAAPAYNPEFDKPWRNFKWEQKSTLKKQLEEFTPSDPSVTDIKILVVGEVGTGKSSFINSVNNVFQNRITSAALVSSSAGRSFTKRLKGYHIRSGKITLPIVFRDIMGLEREVLEGSQPEDIINAVFGHMKDGYKFDESKPLTHEDEHYTSDPSLSDQASCLVYVIDANKVCMADEKIRDKLKIIRQRISDKGIPQVIVMTKVDEACPLVNKDLRKIYHSKKIKKKMQMCSDIVGVPMNYVFPVKNYHEEIDTDDDVDVLILKALDQIVHIADDRLIDDRSY
ncbi:interferon-induced protein 44-like [Triplophysa rosa]|uniref:interferon-induced protein 44-like n=1 Tax=Triplophysa rosa TaxID=992332 RepID=UPI002545F312|nr:interferon-induced protein 44-like [Triplophysa rosa]